MKRDIYQSLQDWKVSDRRKPLILNGSRQVGKTYALKYFAENFYENFIYINFEKDLEYKKFFEKSLDPKNIIQALSLHKERKIKPGETLIIFDEVQNCPRALNSLKYFCEEANEYHVAAAGSLLGVELVNEEGFPVGKVNFLHLYPLTFFEFLTATNHQVLREYLEKIEDFEPIAEPTHNKLLDLLKIYFFVGGMPEAISVYRKNNDFNTVREVHDEILSSYEKDFSKHAPKNQVSKIYTLWEQVPKQLAKENKKFIFSLIRKSARGREYEEALQWMVDAGLIHKQLHISNPKFPLSLYADRNMFKLFFLDVGLLGAKSSLLPKVIVEDHKLFKEFKGALTENFIIQELLANGKNENYYWTSSGTAEVDFVVQSEDRVLPLEVKSGKNSRKKSLLVYGEKYHVEDLSRMTTMNLKKNDKISNYPLYLAGRFPFKKFM